MRKTTITIIVAVLAILLCSLIASAQTANPKPQWKKCPQCQTPEERAASRAKEEKLPFNPKDLTGIWNQNRIQLSREAPPMTDLGKTRYEATKTEVTVNGETVSNSKDPMLVCDPLGWPRWFTYNYGFEFVQMPDRMVQFLEWGHTYRTIWTDGRDLPNVDEVDPRWLGYSVGRWEGDTFVVESVGFDDRSWLSENRVDRRYGYPHSDQAKTIERYHRVSHNAIDVELTITDPKTFTKPWVTKGQILRSPETEIGEYFCVPSEANEHTNRVLLPAAGASAK
jgi:hypothetical protein